MTTFSKSDTFYWFFNLYKITDTIIGTLASSHLNNFPGALNEALVKNITLSLKEGQKVINLIGVSKVF